MQTTSRISKKSRNVVAPASRSTSGHSRTRGWWRRGTTTSPGPSCPRPAPSAQPLANVDSVCKRSHCWCSNPTWAPSMIARSSFAIAGTKTSCSFKPSSESKSHTPPSSPRFSTRSWLCMLQFYFASFTCLSDDWLDAMKPASNKRKVKYWLFHSSDIYIFIYIFAHTIYELLHYELHSTVRCGDKDHHHHHDITTMVMLVMVMQVAI